MKAKNRELIRLLINATREKKIEWVQSSSIGQFRTELESATFVINKLYEYDYSGWARHPILDSCRENDQDQHIHDILSVYNKPKIAVCELTMYNNSNAEIVIAREKDEKTEDFRLLDELYNQARASWIKEEDTIDSVIRELRSKD